MAKRTKKSKETSTPERTKKEERLFQNLLRTAEQYMSGKAYRPQIEKDLMERLHLASQHSIIFNQVLNELMRQNKIEVSKGLFIWRDRSKDIIHGTINVHPRGFGFVRPDDPSNYAEDIFIPKHLIQNAVNGDKVEVLVNTESVSEKGPEGKVINILNRGRTHLAGIIRHIEPFGDIIAYVPMLGLSQRVLVLPGELDLKQGDRLIMEVINWGSKEDETVCRATHKIGHISDASCDIKAAIEEFELRQDFPEQAIKEAEGYGTRVPIKDLKGRLDLREWECFTIDPDTAKDYDDAVSLTKDENGNYELGVHIADVSHYVKKGTELDKEAYERCNSTYFPGFCLPMLPRQLSDNLCSLKQGVNRLTVSVIMRFSEDGSISSYRIARSVIKSNKRFTYREAKAILDGKAKSRHSPTLHLMVELCKKLKKKRYERGSIEFAMPELVVMVNEKGEPTNTDYIEYDITHQLVEEFMLKANETVATHISEAGKGMTYRVHDIPSEENMKDFASLAAAFGFHISETPSTKELQELFDEALKTPYGQYLATCYIRRMRLAIYSPENIGHYGLALTHYCHFTSPIRRYVDLVVHRILLGENAEADSIELIADKCSEQERISARAESSVVLLKKLRLLKKLQDEEPNREFEAVVTRIKNFGFLFEVIELLLESFIHVADLDDDFYSYDEVGARLNGVRTGQTFTAGDKILVRLRHIDFITLDSKWEYICLSEKNITQPSKPKKKQKRLKTKKKIKNKKKR